MNSDVKHWFSAGDLSLLGEQLVASLPTTMRGCTRMAQNKGWVSREVPCMGGKKGMRTEYQPPANVLALIGQFLASNPDFFKKKRGKAAEGEPTQPDKYVMVPAAVEYIAKERDAAAMLLDPNPEDRLRMLKMVLRISEMQLTTPPPPDVAKKVIDLADAWSPFAAKFPDLKERLDTLKATASFFI